MTFHHWIDPKPAGVYPSLVGTVNINGDFEFKDKQNKDNSAHIAPHCNTSNPEPDLGLHTNQMSDKSSEAAAHQFQNIVALREGQVH